MKRVIDALTPNEIQNLLGSFTGRFATRNRNLVVLMLNTGLRIQEACNLNVGDISENGIIRSDIFVRPETAKGKKARYIPLNSTARTAIEELLRFNWGLGFPISPSDPLLISNKGGRLCPQAFQHILRRHRKNLATRLVITPHLFRHTFLSRIYRETRDLQITKELAGHSHISTTMRYMHRTRGEKQRAVALLETGNKHRKPSFHRRRGINGNRQERICI